MKLLKTLKSQIYLMLTLHSCHIILTYSSTIFFKQFAMWRLYNNQFTGVSSEAVDLKLSQGTDTTKAPKMLALGLPAPAM